MTQTFGAYPLNEAGLEQLRRETEAVKRKIRREAGFPPECSGLNPVQIQELLEKLAVSPLDDQQQEKIRDKIKKNFNLLKDESVKILLPLIDQIRLCDTSRLQAHFKSNSELEPHLQLEVEEIKERFFLGEDGKKVIQRRVEEDRLVDGPIRPLLARSISEDNELATEVKKELLGAIAPLSEKIMRFTDIDEESRVWLNDATVDVGKTSEYKIAMKTLTREIENFLGDSRWQTKCDVAICQSFNSIDNLEKQQIAEKLNNIARAVMTQYADNFCLAEQLREQRQNQVDYGVNDNHVILQISSNNILRESLTAVRSLGLCSDDALALSGSMIGGVSKAANKAYVNAEVYPMLGIKTMPMDEKIEKISAFQGNKIQALAASYRHQTPNDRFR